VPSVRFSFPVSDRPTSATLSAVISARFITGDRRRRRVPRIDSTRYSIERAQTNGCRSGASVGWARRAVILFRLRNWHRAARKLGDRSVIATSVLWRTDRQCTVVATHARADRPAVGPQMNLSSPLAAPRSCRSDVLRDETGAWMPDGYEGGQKPGQTDRLQSARFRRLRPK